MATLKQEKAVNEIVEKGRTSVSAVMRDVGYSEKTAVDPSKLTKSKGYQELIAKKLPIKKVLSVHRKGLDATKFITGKFGSAEVADWPSRAKFVEMAYRRLGLDNVIEVGFHYHEHMEQQRKEYEGI